jgi:DNA-binding transcriptional regulator YdaS (Cro superfamily)
MDQRPTLAANMEAGMDPTLSKFGAWIKAYGTRALARRLGVHPSAVTLWKTGRTQPTLDHATEILKLAKGKLKPGDLKKAGAGDER